MIQLIVNADDFGYSRAVNHGIIDSHVNGIVNSTTIMMNMPGTEHAIQLSKEHPTLKVGIHLVLTCGKPLLNNVPSLVNEQGNFKKLSSLSNYNGVNTDEVYQEWSAQIERALSYGINLTHFDSHHNVHGIKELASVVHKLATTYKLPVRNSLQLPEGVQAFTDVFLHDFYGETVVVDYFDKLLDKVTDGKSVEVMCHPAYLDNEVLLGSSYNVDRLKEYDILTSTVLPANIELI
ncbi:chitin disaccharide deacetylase [Metabacillus herbersteinensis]|uniref:Carbohydrate deacetylase n=1 Tax=Metabacillus herbersteinensis TaxID=283816 RepID=A0ABV6GJ35_9BACI